MKIALLIIFSSADWGRRTQHHEENRTHVNRKQKKNKPKQALNEQQNYRFIASNSTSFKNVDKARRCAHDERELNPKLQ